MSAEIISFAERRAAKHAAELANDPGFGGMMALAKEMGPITCVQLFDIEGQSHHYWKTAGNPLPGEPTAEQRAIVIQAESLLTR
jgi:hypothetical protein